MKKAIERKQKLIKNRLLMALGATDNMNLEDAVKMACDILQKYRANLMTMPKQSNHNHGDSNQLSNFSSLRCQNIPI